MNSTGLLKGRISAVTLLVVLAAVYFSGMCVFVLARYEAFQTNAFDLGIFNQAFSTALKGMLFYETPDQYAIASGSFLGTHFSLLMFLILPIYAIYPHPQTLLVLQTGVVALGSVPIFLIARRLLSEKLALVMAAAFLVDPAILSLNIYDFHLEAFLPFFLGMFYYYYLVSNWKGYSLFLALSLITIDFAALIVVAICLAHGLHSLKRRGGALLGLGLDLDKKRLVILTFTIMLSLIVFYITLYLSGVYSGNKTSVGGILSGFLTPSQIAGTLTDKSEFWLLPLAILMFLPLLAPSQLAMVAPWFFAMLLENAHPTNYSFGYQYAGAFVLPYLMIAAIFALQKLRIRKANITGFLVGIFVFSLLLSPLNPLTQGRVSGISYEEGLPTVTPHDAIINDALAMIPANASVLTQNNLFPQLSDRPDAYVYLIDNTTSIQYVFADTISSWYSTVIWGTQSMKSLLPLFMGSGHYGVLVNDDGVILLKEDYSGPPQLVGPTTYIYDYHQLDLFSGSKISDPSSVSGTVLYHSSTDESGVTFWYGPYASMPPGTYNATFWLKTSSTTNGSINLIVSNFVNDSSITVLAQRQISQDNFPAPGSWTSFTLEFQYTPQQASAGILEFRGFSIAGGPFSLDYVAVSYISPW